MELEQEHYEQKLKILMAKQYVSLKIIQMYCQKLGDSEHELFFCRTAEAVLEQLKNMTYYGGSWKDYVDAAKASQNYVVL